MEDHGYHITHIRRGKGCPVCNQTGYRGRLAIHEVLPINRHVRDMILSKKSASAINDYMMQQGYKTLLEDGLFKVTQGFTTIEEVIRVANTE